MSNPEKPARSTHEFIYDGSGPCSKCGATPVNTHGDQSAPCPGSGWGKAVVCNLDMKSLQSGLDAALRNSANEMANGVLKGHTLDGYLGHYPKPLLFRHRIRHWWITARYNFVHFVARVLRVELDGGY